MTDRELLEAAANAAGIDLSDAKWHDDMQKFVFRAPRVPNWNPLTDDGDALRLAVKMHICIQPHTDWCDATDGTMVIHENSRGDPGAATRRAIVRAAASCSTHHV